VLQEAGVAGEGGAPAEQQSRGLGGWLQSKLEGKAGLVMDKVGTQQQLCLVICLNL
jgi:hypothetical protein